MEVGIDFGTTFSTLCFSAGRGVDGCVSEAGSIYIPTIVGIRPDGSYCIGRGALLEPNILLYRDIKRWFGCNKHNVRQYRAKLQPSYAVVPRDWDVSIGPVNGNQAALRPVTELAALFIKGLCELAVQLTGIAVTRSVISVPADYNSYKRSYVYEAATFIGVGVQAVVNEPTAAGLSAFTTISRSETKYILVYDFGGGTFDASLLVVGSGYVCVVDSRGDNYLGGRDIDAQIADTLSRQLKLPTSALDEFSMEAVKLAANKSASITTHQILLKSGEVKSVNFSRSDLLELCRPFVSRTIRILTSLLDKCAVASVVAVLVGGSSVLPGVRDSVAMLPAIKTVVFSQETFRAAVAIGAALYAQSFSTTARYRLIDAVSASLSDERRPMRAELIIPKSHPIPTQLRIPFTMPKHDTAFVLHEGERSAIQWNERSFSASIRMSVFKPGVEYDQTITIGEDGRISVTMGNTMLENVVRVPKLNSAVLSAKFESTEMKLLKPEVSDYFVKWKQLTRRDIEDLSIQEREQVYISHGVKSYNDL
uniref:HSP70h n=1 Tax=Manihot esculenta associated ampelovirus 2 TaxID=2843332 RepID=A0A8F1NME6_9CLOS|nr:HSP70h [Manihot esculenta associated ampelovirus 2]QWQ59705.1 HSP70h [Manihot esculenta associated ampelovirus 2]